jgi:phage terminase large subunit GpA-like protein
MPDTQDRLAAHIAAKRFVHPYLGEIAPYAMAIDYGHQTKVRAVFNFCRHHRTCGSTRVYAIKGFDQSLSALWEQHYDRRYHVQKFYFNVDAFKSTIFDRLRITEAGPRCIHIPKETVSYIARDGVRRSYSTTFNTSFYTELCSERRIPKRNKDGTLSYQWVKISQSARNEPLDLMDYVYGLYETQKLGGWIGQQYGRVQRLMRDRETESKAVPGSTGSTGSTGVPPAAPGVPPDATSTPTPPQSQARSGKVQESAPNRPATRPQRRPQTMKRRPPWGKSGGFFNPLGL